jgi:hypothetical protein
MRGVRDRSGFYTGQRFRWLAVLLVLSLVVNAVSGALAGYVHAHAVHRVHASDHQHDHWSHHSDDYDHDHDHVNAELAGLLAEADGAAAPSGSAGDTGPVLHDHAPTLVFALAAAPSWPLVHWRQSWRRESVRIIHYTAACLLERPPRLA